MRSPWQMLALSCSLALALAGCGNAPGTGAGASADRGAPADGGRVAGVAQVGHLDAVETRAFLAENPDALVLDVRNPDEWDNELGHIEGARLLPLPELAARMGELEAWKDKPIVCVCRSGRRSLTAGEMLAQAGYRRLINLEGGMIAWRETEGAAK